MKINFIDLYSQYSSIKNEIDEVIKKVIEDSAFSSGPYVKSFEENFALAHRAKYCVGVNSGTSALHIVLWALGIGLGDEIIVPTNTFFATPEAVSLTGACPVFVDCEQEYFNVEPEKIGRVITSKTKAIIVVHLYGQPAQLDKLKEIAAKNNLLLIEDCAQAHLAEYKDKPVGTFGICGCFSFYPGKNLGAFGEAGAVVTNDEKLYLKMLELRNHGSSEKYYHDSVGHNYRMEGIQGAVLGVKLKYLTIWTEKRRNNAILYNQYLQGIKEIILHEEMNNTKHVYHLFVVRVKKRDELRKFLQNNSIPTLIHYPVPCHEQKAYEFLNKNTDNLDVSENVAKEILSLPMYAELTEREIKFICEKIGEFFNT